jgi:NADPH:quinone reductase-like Zn-dependent oxidoreductase
MRRALAHGGAGIDAITIETSAIPEPGAGEALVRIHVATLNFRDLIGVKGLIPGMAGDNYVPLSCSAGEVVAIGAGVTRVAVGDRVAPVFDQGWVSGDQTSRKPNSLGARIDGVARDYAVFSEVGLSRLPDEVSDLEAATLPCAGLTAWNALFLARATQPGDVVVVQGTGGVSIAALQFAKAAGAMVIVMSSSDNKLARAKSLGADHVIDYTKEDFTKNADRYDVMLDNVGNHSLSECKSVLTPTGKYVLIGGGGANDQGFLGGLGKALWAMVFSKFVNQQMGMMLADANQKDLTVLADMMQSGKLKPVIDRTYKLEQVPDAIRYVEQGHARGKVVITVE